MGYLIAVSAGCPFAVTTVFVPAELGFYKRESAQSAVDRINAAISRAEAAEAALALAQQERDSLRAAYETAFNEGYRLSNNLHIVEAECERLREQAAALRALIAQAVQADLDDDAFALEAAIVRMAAALDDSGDDARGG